MTHSKFETNRSSLFYPRKQRGAVTMTNRHNYIECKIWQRIYCLFMLYNIIIVIHFII